MRIGIEKDTAVLLFTRSAKEEAKAKSFMPNAPVSLNEQIASGLIHHTIRQIRKSGLPCYTIDSARQAGNTFQERLFNAFSEVFHAGYSHVIAIGNDCPQLKPADLLFAQDQLSHGNAVLGPARDGGVYLIGLSRNIFEKINFSSIRWNSSSVFEDFRWLCAQSGIAITSCRNMVDIDNAYDIKIYSALVNDFSSLFVMIRNIIASAIQIFLVVKAGMFTARKRLRKTWRSPPLSFSC